MHNNIHNARAAAQIHTPRPALDRATIIAKQAHRWTDYMLAHGSTRRSFVYRKALGAIDFSIRTRARSLFIPTKLQGTSRHQEALRLLDELNPLRGHRLDVEEQDSRLVVAFADMQLGALQPKYTAGLRPLLAHGARVHLLQVTGTDAPHKTLGCNVAFAGVVPAIDRLQRASRPWADDGDVLLWRDEQGRACMSVPHIVRHSPSGPEWGYAGSGPADAALSILTHVAGTEAADSLYQRYKHAVIAALPDGGARLSVAAVEAWVALQRL